MRIAIDIDGTLCWSNLPVFLEECNTTFELGIATTILQDLTTKEAFYMLPEVATRLVQKAAARRGTSHRRGTTIRIERADDRIPLLG